MSDTEQPTIAGDDSTDLEGHNAKTYSVPDPERDQEDVDGHNFRGFVTPDEDQPDDVKGHSSRFLGAVPPEDTDTDDAEGHSASGRF